MLCNTELQNNYRFNKRMRLKECLHGKRKRNLLNYIQLRVYEVVSSGEVIARDTVSIFEIQSLKFKYFGRNTSLHLKLSDKQYQSPIALL